VSAKRGGSGALSALPRLQLELTPSPGTRLQRQQDPLVRLKLKKLPTPLRTVERTRRVRWRSEPRVSRRR
jgi:hypothetical protein